MAGHSHNKAVQLSHRHYGLKVRIYRLRSVLEISFLLNPVELIDFKILRKDSCECCILFKGSVAGLESDRSS